MQTPLVSIIIPTYNRAHLIGETLESILAQTYTHWECIVVDDGSADTTEELLINYCIKDSRFQYHHRPADRPKGANACRNYGFELSKGEYIQWFDSDDLMIDNLLSKKMQVYSNINCKYDYIISGFEVFNIEGNINYKYNLGYFKNKTESFIKGDLKLNTQSFLFRKTSVDFSSFNENLTRAQDLDFIFRFLTQNSTEGLSINEVLSKIRYHKNTITSNYGYNKIKDLESELFVRYLILVYFRDTEDKQYSKIALKKYLMVLKKVLSSKHMKLFFLKVNSIEELSIRIKIKLNLLGILYFFTKRGLSKYSNILKCLN